MAGVPREMVFLVEEQAAGGYCARCEGECVFTEADSIEDLYRQVREAVCCHCDEAECPQFIRLRFAGSGREEVIDA